MSKSPTPQRLYTPRSSRVVAPRVDPDAVGQITESVARFFGTGRYLLLQTVLVVAWIALNVSAVSLRWDPYPFILLNLFLSMLAAIQAPVIMMSQNRQDTKDRLRSELDFDVNRRAESEIQGLAHKIHLLTDKVSDVEDFLRGNESARS
jgi:uncharacterized membrane protein